MSTEILDGLFRLRAQTRSTTVLFAVAASVAVVLIPLAYRNEMPHRILVMLPTVVYLALSTYRLIGGFQTDRQLEFEERFIRFALKKNELLASAQAGGKLWKLSCVVQGLNRASTAAVPDFERRKHLFRSLRSTSRLLMPPVVSIVVPAALALALAWTYVAWQDAGVRGVLYVAVLPAFAVIGWVEARVVFRRRLLTDAQEGILSHVADWASREWSGFQQARSVHPYRHRMLYRDRAHAG